MDYDSEENSSASASDCKGEFNNNNIDDGDSDDNHNNDAHSNASYGENLRVRSLSFSFEVLMSNYSGAFRMTSRLPLLEISNSGGISPSTRHFR